MVYSLVHTSFWCRDVCIILYYIHKMLCGRHCIIIHVICILKFDSQNTANEFEKKEYKMCNKFVCSHVADKIIKAKTIIPDVSKLV